MILSFNPQVFESDQEEVLRRLSQIFDLIIMERQLIDLVDSSSFFSTVFDEEGYYIFDEGKFSINSLSNIQKNRFENFFNVLLQRSAYNTEKEKKYLTKLNIGFNDNEVSPEVAFNILSNSSKIIVENATNDWKFIRGIIDKYAKHKVRRSIYLRIQKAFESRYLEAEQAGGKGQIISRFEDLKENRYKDISQYKLMTIFDSDRNDNTSINEEQKSIIKYFKGKDVTHEDAIHEDSDLIIWHMFYKTELENYIPIDVLVSELPLTEIERADLHSKTPDEIDFVDFEHYLRGNPNSISVKRDFPELFLKEWTRDKIEKRCEHHKVSIELPNGILEEVSEIEQLLLKIAKII